MSRKDRPIPTALEALRGAFKDMGLTDQARRVAVVGVWQTAVGAEIAERTEPFAFSRGILSIRVGSSAWLQELALLAPRLVDRINHELGSKVVKDLRLFGGKIYKNKPDPRPAWLDGPDATEALERAEATSLPIKDPDVRAAFERLVLLDEKKKRAQSAK